MPSDVRNSSNDGRESDDWLSGTGEFDWGDEPSGPGRPVGTRTGSRQPAADEPLWPDQPAERADAATIMRRRILWLSVAGALVVILIAVFALGGNDSENTPTTAVTTPIQPTTTATTPKTQTTPKTPTTPTAQTLTLPDGEALQLGSTGAEVLALQQALKTLGLDPGAADGDFGATTANAVGEFQRAHNLGDDGVAGAATIAAMNTALAAEASGA